MKTFWVSFCGPIVALYPYTYVLAENEIEAIDIVREKKMLNTHPLNPDFLNKYCRYTAKEIKSGPFKIYTE